MAADSAGVAAATPGFTVTDVGRLLSRERNRQGLSLRDVAMRTGIPVEQLRAAETGVLDQPDGLATLKTVRRYADLLGLPGDRFALAILERWPTKGGVPRPLTGPTAAISAFGPLTISGTAAAAGNGNGHTGAPANGNGNGNHTSDARPAGEPTAMVDRIYAAQGSWPGGGASYWGAYSDTGVTPAVLAPAGQVRRRPRRAVPGALRALVVLVTIALVVGAALLGVDRTRPSWLRAIGLTRANSPTSAPVAAHAPTSTGHRTSGHGATVAAELRPHASGGDTVFTVRASSFSVELTAPGGPCWVQVTTNGSSTPAWAGIVDAGAPRTFSHVHSLVVELGSTSGRVSVTSTGGHVANYAPPGAPYRVTVHSGN